MPQDQSAKFDATQLLNQPEELIARAEKDGFLFFKNIVPKIELLKLRKQVLKLLKKVDLLSDEHALMEGIVDFGKINKLKKPTGTCGNDYIYSLVQKMKLFHKIAHHPNIISIFKTLFKDEVLVHPRNIMRIVMPSKGTYPTDPHQDFVYINGTLNTWTSWIPLGDCPMETGNLAIMRGSHKFGMLPVVPGKGAGGLSAILDGLQQEWIHFNYEVGDLVMFTSQTVHKSIPTQNPERIRLSIDYRYQALSQPVHPSSLQPHMMLTWNDIYKNWGADELKYYWKKMDLNISNNVYLKERPELKKNNSEESAYSTPTVS